MPTYVYKFVKTGETIEVQQSFTEPTLTSVKHPESGRKMTVKKVFTPVGVTFRGDGFYKTDSRVKSSKKTDSKPDSGGESKPDSGGESKPSSTDSSTSTTSTSTSEKSEKSEKSDKSASTSSSNKSDAKAGATP